jgi:signal transduction histidine kinase
MVSHNLRSYTNSLKSVIDLHQSTEQKSDRDEAFIHIKSISDSLGKTIEQMTEVVKIQLEIAKEKQTVPFEALFNNTMAGLQLDIADTGAKIEYDFSKCPFIDYIAAYLDSIFQNLLTNAIKYRSSERKPVIYCYTYQEDSQIYLVFKDNGKGIDLDRFGDRVFGMYETFHENTDAKGIGLFITRSQVESLGGSIEIESKVNVGTTFTIKLA